jgi:type IV pilus assembly protein PilA
MLNMKRNQKGFTLIELMIVIAIVAILVALAVPAYQDYTIRAKVGECINGAAVAKLQISEYRETVGSFPADATEAGTATPGGQTAEYCDGWNYPGTSGSGSFDVLVNEANVDTSIVGAIEPNLRGAVNASGGVDWECNQGGTDAANIKYLPSTCRGT